MERITHALAKVNRSLGDALGLIGVGLLALALRAYRLDRLSLWVDEAFSVWLARQPLTEMVAWIARIDQHPPLYYLTLAGWGRVWGWSEAGVRSLSVVWSVMTLPLVWAIGRQVGGARVGWIAAVVFALAPLHVRYAQEARMYALLTWGTALMVWAALQWMTEMVPRRWHQWALGIGGLTTLYAHHMGVLFVGAVLGGLVLWAFAGPGHRARRPLGRVVACLLIGWGLWVPVLVHQAAGVLRRFWIPYPTWETVANFVRALHAAYTPTAGLFRLIDGVLLGVFGYAVWVLLRRAHGHGRWPVILLLLVTVAPVLAALAVSPVRPVFQTRTLIAVGVPYVVLIALGLATFPWQRVALLGLVGWLALNVWGLYGVYTRPDPEPWRDVAAHVSRLVQPGDLLLFHASWVALPFDYYFPAEIAVVRRGVPVDRFERGELEPLMRPEDVPALRALVAPYPRVWLIYSHDWYTDPEGWVPRTLDAVLCRESVWQWPGIQVILYLRPENTGCEHVRRGQDLGNVAGRPNAR